MHQSYKLESQGPLHALHAFQASHMLSQWGFSGYRGLEGTVARGQHAECTESHSTKDEIKTEMWREFELFTPSFFIYSDIRSPNKYL